MNFSTREIWKKKFFWKSAYYPDCLFIVDFKFPLIYPLQRVNNMLSLPFTLLSCTIFKGFRNDLFVRCQNEITVAKRKRKKGMNVGKHELRDKTSCERILLLAQVSNMFPREKEHPATPPARVESKRDQQEHPVCKRECRNGARSLFIVPAVYSPFNLREINTG